MKNTLLPLLPVTLLIPLAGPTAAQSDFDPETGSQGPVPGLGASNAERGGPSSGLLPDEPLVFLENVGQWPAASRFAARRGSVTIGVETSAFQVAVEREAGLSITRFEFENAREDVTLEPLEALPGVTNIYGGNDPDRWATGLTRHGRLAYRGLYEGVDLLLRTQEGHLEYDVLLQPGADLQAFSVHCEGAKFLSLGEDGELLLHTSNGVLRQTAPITWAEAEDGTREPIDCRFVLLGETRYGFELAERPAGQAVVIDPGLEWSTYVGGTGDDIFWAIERDAQGRLLLSGGSSSSGWALPGGTLDTNGGFDAIVALLDPSLPGPQQMVWWTYFGGSLDEVAQSIQTNNAGDVFVTGFTDSPDLPTTSNAYDQSLGGNKDGFVARLEPVTGTLLYSSFIGGSEDDTTHRILVQEPAVVTVGGGTESTDLPTTPNAHQPAFGGVRDIMFAVLDLDQSGPASLQYMSYFGGSAQDGWVTERQLEMRYAANGELLLAGSVQSFDLPVPANASFSPVLGGGQDGVLASFDLGVAGPGALTYIAYLGGTGGQGAQTLDVDPTGGLIVTGFTYSSLFPTTPGAAFNSFTGQNEPWLMKIDPSAPIADQLVYSTILPGGFGFDIVFDAAVDDQGTVFTSGYSGQNGLQFNGMPTTCGAFDTVAEGDWTGTLFALTPAGNGRDDLHYASFFGGTVFDQCGALLVESGAGNPVVTVSAASSSPDAPTTAGVFQPVSGGAFDSVVFRLQLNPFFFCEAEPNSVSPIGARICATGSVALADNALDLAVTSLPSNSFGIFVMSTSQVSPFPLAAPSGGQLCLGSPIVRFSGSILNSGSTGTVSFTPDLLNIPPPGSVLVPGDTAYFQYWYRDTPGAALPANTSNGVAVTFE